MDGDGSRFIKLREVSLNDGGDSPNIPGPFRYAIFRLTHVDDISFFRDDGQHRPVAGFLDEAEPRLLSEWIELNPRSRPLTLAIDIEQLRERLSPEQKHSLGESLMLKTQLLRVTKDNQVAAEMTVEYKLSQPNPFWHDQARDGRADQSVPEGGEAAGQGTIAPAQPTLAAAQETPRRWWDPALSVEQEQDGEPRLLIAAGYSDEDWRDISDIAPAIERNVPILQAWPGPDFPLLRLKVELTQQKPSSRLQEVVFAIRFQSEAQRNATGLLLKQDGNVDPLVPSLISRLDEDGIEFRWTWQVGIGTEYRLCLTSRPQWLSSPNVAIYNPAAPFINPPTLVKGGAKDPALQDLRVCAGMSGPAPEHCLVIHPVRNARGDAPVRLAELNQYAAVNVSHADGFGIVRLSQRPGDQPKEQVALVEEAKPIQFSLAQVSQTTINMRLLSTDDRQAKNIVSVFLSDSVGEHPGVRRPLAAHWSVRVAVPDSVKRSRSKSTLEATLRITNFTGPTEVPIKVKIRPSRPLIALAIDVGASAIAVAIASTLSSENAALILPIGSVQKTIDSNEQKRDRLDMDRENPHLIASCIGISSAVEPLLRISPWHANPSFDPRLRGGEPTLFELPDNVEKVRDRLKVSATNDRPGRRIEVHLPVPLNASKDDGVFVIRDLKMKVCRNGDLSSDNPVVVRDGRDTRWREESKPKRIGTADLLAHVIELILSVYVPEAAYAESDSIRKQLRLEEWDEWDALSDQIGGRDFLLALSRPASLGQAGLARYDVASDQALLKHFGPRFESIDASLDMAIQQDGVGYRTVSEALSVDAALRYSGHLQEKSSNRRRVVIDIGSATTDVAVIDYPTLGAWGTVRASFALPVAAAAFRRWIAYDIRDAAARAQNRTQLGNLAVLADDPEARRQLGQRIDEAIRNYSDEDSQLAVYLHMMPAGRRISIPADEAGGIRFAQFEAASTDLAAFLPAHKPDSATSGAEQLILHYGLDRLAAVIAKAIQGEIGSQPDMEVDVILSGRGAAFAPLERAIARAFKLKRVSRVSKLLCPNGDQATQLSRMKTVVAEGAALRALAIETGSCEVQVEPPYQRYALVVGRAIEQDGTKVFSHIESVHRLTQEEVIRRNGQRFWLARFVPSLVENDLGPLTERMSDSIKDESIEGVALEIARACIVPVDEVARNGDSIQLEHKVSELLITVDGGINVESRQLSDDGSYA